MMIAWAYIYPIYNFYRVMFFKLCVKYQEIKAQEVKYSSI
jgi:hypothetical protein